MIATLVFSFNANAKNCIKGQPCGNSCISWDKVCHINTPKYFGSNISSPSAANLTENINPLKNEMQVHAEMNCMVSWQAILDRFLFNKQEEEVINDVINRSVAIAKSKSIVMSEQQIVEIRESYKQSLKTTETLTNDLLSLRKDPESFRQIYFPLCVRQIIEMVEVNK
ncbi:hypothetical protein [Shewanella xiamenensis]|uniref:hypothetical protein n=1 Tax=Shewanella xiamenensis TaxID=332186 RepID=UPI002119E130|nr:hypothetical protein [Shewanella xiamenensis]